MVKIYDLSGKFITASKTIKTASSIKVLLDKELTKGTYFVEVYNKQGFVTMKKITTK